MSDINEISTIKKIMEHKTLIFCTAYSDISLESNCGWDDRYRIWLDAILQSRLNFDQILMVDDGSAMLPAWADITIIQEGKSLLSNDKIVFYHFKTRLGRRAVMDFPGWIRSFFFAAAWAQVNNFTRIIHIESDAFLISERIQQYCNDVIDGWVALWCPRYQWPESGIQIIAGKALNLYYNFAQRPIEEFIGIAPERSLPFTHVETVFIGDRFGEYLDYVPQDADWTMQTYCKDDQQRRQFYWWLSDIPVDVRKYGKPAQIALDQILVDAINHHHAGRIKEAEGLYRTILASPCVHAVASYSLGLLCTVQGRQQEAIDAYRHAIAIRPDFVDAYINLGTANLEMGRPEEAAALYRYAIVIEPSNAMAFGNLGKALQDLNRIDEAIAAYRDALHLQPDNAVVCANFGAALLDKQAWESSITITQRSIALKPGNAIAYANLGTALLNLGRYEEALFACRQAISLHPQGAAICASLGGAMLELGALQEAIALCQSAITFKAVRPDAYFNLSHALKAVNELEEAALAARQAIALNPESAEYHFHLAHILLLQGDLEAGWVEYDWRWKLADFAWVRELHGVFSQPLWSGEDIDDKTILIYTEQGFGDVVQFIRYLPLMVRKAKKVIVAIHLPIHRLLQTIEGITVISIREGILPDFDVHCPLMSLPRAFATQLDTIPASVPYLRPDPTVKAHWVKRIHSHKLRVGIVWAGNPATKRDRFRSPHLASVASLFSLPNIDFFVLQVGEGRRSWDTTSLPLNVLDLGKEINDWADTAAIMSELDLMISSCTGPLHLAGALGVPSWAMIPFAPHFPWLLKRTDTLWYPTMRLYRQEQPGQDWSDVVNRISFDLSSLAQSNRDGRSNWDRLISENLA